MAAPVLPVPTSLFPCCILGCIEGNTVKLFILLPVPPKVLSEMEPSTVPGITITTKVLPSFEIGMAAIPPKVTLVKLSKSKPVIVSKVPTEPDEGEKLLILG